MMLFIKNNVLLAICFILLRLITHTLGTAPAIFVFGDSLLDSGNNNYLQTTAKANFLPYGFDFNNGPTGRFTNGRTVVDILAEKLGLPYAPPYLGLVGKAIPRTGVNYASASCGILDETGSKFGKCLPLSKQVDNFEETVKHLPSSSSEYLANSIFISSIGSNDYIINYLQPSFYHPYSLTPDQFAQLLVDKLLDQLKRLYNLGARKFVVFDIGPLGCIPGVVAFTNSTSLCIDVVNQQVNLYNQKLAERLRGLQEILIGTKIVFAQSYELSLKINLNPTQYGFQEANIPCCAVTMVGTCTPGGAVCLDRKIYRSFDAIHPTDAFYSIFANSCFDQSPSICSPLTVKQLAQ